MWRSRLQVEYAKCLAEADKAGEARDELQNAWDDAKRALDISTEADSLAIVGGSEAERQAKRRQALSHAVFRQQVHGARDAQQGPLQNLEKLGGETDFLRGTFELQKARSRVTEDGDKLVEEFQKLLAATDAYECLEGNYLR